MVAGHRSAEPGASVALACLGLTPLVDLGLRLGATEYLNKPVDRDHLLAILERYRHPAEEEPSPPPDPIKPVQ